MLVRGEKYKMQNNNDLLKDKLILITGGSVGIGYVVAEKCVEAGAQVILCSRTEKDLKTAIEKLKKINSKNHLYRVLNVGDQNAVKNCTQWVQKEFGYLDGLVNCAGVYGPIGPLNQIDINEFVQAIQINFLGTVFTCHYFSDLMMNRKAKIVNYSGGGASGPFPNYSAYATSKSAIVRLTENLVQEFQPLGIQVNVVGPGFVATRLHEQTIKAGDKAGKAFLEKTKAELSKGGVPPEMAAHLTVFLLSDESSGVNGKFISANWDEWEKPAFIERLKKDKNFATLRRIDDKNFRGTN